MKKILFYGNCQVDAINKTLCLSSDEYEVYQIRCFWPNADKEYFTNIIKNADYIITQPINDNYKNVDYLSTKYIINNCNENCKIIIFDSCHFNFYYVDLTYKHINNDILHKPIDYHYHNMIKEYLNNMPIDDYIEKYVNNINLESSEYLEDTAQKSLQSLLDRYNNSIIKFNDKRISIISTHDYIKNNYKDKLLFYSMNHPTKYLIQFICEGIIKILEINNTIDYNIDILEHTRCILYKCIQKNVNFDITLETPLLHNETDLKKIINKYYDAYKEINLC